jgi:hypothetical protein
MLLARDTIQPEYLMQLMDDATAAAVASAAGTSGCALPANP